MKGKEKQKCTPQHCFLGNTLELAPKGQDRSTPKSEVTSTLHMINMFKNWKRMVRRRQKKILDIPRKLVNPEPISNRVEWS